MVNFIIYSNVRTDTHTPTDRPTDQRPNTQIRDNIKFAKKLFHSPIDDIYYVCAVHT
jgi:hypothetical protein